MKVRRKLTQKLLKEFAKNAVTYKSYNRKLSDPKHNRFVFDDRHEAGEFGYWVYEMYDKDFDAYTFESCMWKANEGYVEGYTVKIQEMLD